MTPETGSAGNLEEAVPAQDTGASEITSGAGAEGADETPRTADGTPGTAGSAPSETGHGASQTGREPPEILLISEISGALRDLADSSQRYHARAEQREGIIDHLRSEVELLRRGERRGLLRPLLTDMCRLRNDLLRQAADLPPDYDAVKAAELLVSYAESIQLTLESNGVITYVPDDGEPFNPRMHRRVAGETSADPALAGRIAHVRRDGYLDVEANSPIAPAEVTVFAALKGEQ